jgi:hypothetical protein
VTESIIRKLGIATTTIIDLYQSEKAKAAQKLAGTSFFPSGHFGEQLRRKLGAQPSKPGTTPAG